MAEFEKAIILSDNFADDSETVVMVNHGSKQSFLANSSVITANTDWERVDTHHNEYLICSDGVVRCHESVNNEFSYQEVSADKVPPYDQELVSNWQAKYAGKAFLPVIRVHSEPVAPDIHLVFATAGQLEDLHLTQPSYLLLDEDGVEWSSSDMSAIRLLTDDDIIMRTPQTDDAEGFFFRAKIYDEAKVAALRAKYGPPT